MSTVPSPVDLAQAIRAIMARDPLVQKNDLSERLRERHPTWLLTHELLLQYTEALDLRFTKLKASNGSSVKASSLGGVTVKQVQHQPQDERTKSADAEMTTSAAAALEMKKAGGPDQQTASTVASQPSRQHVPAATSTARPNQQITQHPVPTMPNITWPLAESPLRMALRALLKHMPQVSFKEATLLLRNVTDSGWEGLSEQLVERMMQEELATGKTDALAQASESVPGVSVVSVRAGTKWMCSDYEMRRMDAACQRVSVNRETVLKYFVTIDNLESKGFERANNMMRQTYPHWKVANNVVRLAFNSAVQSQKDKQRKRTVAPAANTVQEETIRATAVTELTKPQLSAIPTTSPSPTPRGASNIVLSIPINLGPEPQQPQSLPTAPQQLPPVTLMQPTTQLLTPVQPTSKPKRSLFTPYKTLGEAQKLVSAGEAIVGTVHIHDIDSAVVESSLEKTLMFLKGHALKLKHEYHDTEISLQNIYARNRCLPGDVVVVQINSSNWKRGTVIFLVGRNLVNLVQQGTVLDSEGKNRDKSTQKGHNLLDDTTYLVRPDSSQYPCVRIPKTEIVRIDRPVKVDFGECNWPESERYPCAHVKAVTVKDGEKAVSPPHTTNGASTRSYTSPTIPTKVVPTRDPIPLLLPPVNQSTTSPTKTTNTTHQPTMHGSPKKPAEAPQQPPYTTYLAALEIEQGLKDGTLVKGQLRINARNSAQAFCQVDFMTEDIFIDGIKARNRAYDGDVVVVKIIETADQRRKHAEKIMERRQALQGHQDAIAKTETGTPLLTTTTTGQSGQNGSDAQVVPITGQNGDDDDDEWEDTDSEDGPLGDGGVPTVKGYTEEPVALLLEEAKVESTEQLLSNGIRGSLQSKGVVVGILSAHKPVLLAGQMAIEENKQKYIYEKRPGSSPSKGKEETMAPRPSSRFFKPKNPRFPAVILHDPIPENTTGQLLLVELDVLWPETSFYPHGRVARILGPVGDIEAETVGILMEHEVDFADFSTEVLACLPPTPWKPSPDQIAKRRDVRSHRVFSIDPPTARDLDDALHIERRADGKWEVGVHIADVSFFVPEGSAIDHEARARATTVYMVQRAIPMLPRLLCEDLCSLNAGVDRYAFSAIFVLNDVGQVESKWFGLTIMRSCARLTYDNAQHIIEGKPLEQWNVVVHDGISQEQLAEDIRALDCLAKRMRTRRFETGVLALNKSKLSFALDDNGRPTSCRLYELKESNKLVEEFMLLANMAVAQQIFESHPMESLLRRHPSPDPNGIRTLVAKAKMCGICLDVTSSKTLQASLNGVADPFKRQVLQLLATVPMKPASYFCTADFEETFFWHYALCAPYYSHFTSPIRRYADVIVHRLLQSSLFKGQQTEDAHAAPLYSFTLPSSDVSDIAKICNHKKTMSKKAQAASSDLFLCIYLDRVGSAMETASIVDIREHDVRLLVTAFALEVVIPIKDIAVRAQTSGLDSLPTLTLYWGERSAGNLRGASSAKAVSQILRVFDRVNVRLTGNLMVSPCKVVVQLVPPTSSL